jgi:hypothetical protein
MRDIPLSEWAYLPRVVRVLVTKEGPLKALW